MKVHKDKLQILKYIPRSHNMPNIVIVRGIPGAGKTTYVKTNDEFKNYVYLDADMFHTSNGVYSFQCNNIQASHEWCKEKARQSYNDGKDVVIANTFTQKWEIDSYLTVLGVNVDSTNVRIIHVNGAFANIHGVPDSSINAMKYRWESIEFHEVIIVPDDNLDNENNGPRKQTVNIDKQCGMLENTKRGIRLVTEDHDNLIFDSRNNQTDSSDIQVVYKLCNDRIKENAELMAITNNIIIEENSNIKQENDELKIYNASLRQQLVVASRKNPTSVAIDKAIKMSERMFNNQFLTMQITANTMEALKENIKMMFDMIIDSST